MCRMFDFSFTDFIVSRNIFLFIPVSMFLFYCHYYFHYVYFLDYKKPPLGPSQSSINNQVYTLYKQKISMERKLDILVGKQPKPEEIIDKKNSDSYCLKSSYGISLGSHKLTIRNFLRMKN